MFRQNGVTGPHTMGRRPLGVPHPVTLSWLCQGGSWWDSCRGLLGTELSLPLLHRQGLLLHGASLVPVGRPEPHPERLCIPEPGEGQEGHGNHPASWSSGTR